MKKYLLLVSIVAIFSFSACKSLPKDKRIQSSINEHYKLNDSIKITVVGKYKFSERVYKINYSQRGILSDDIVLLPLENGEWVLKDDNESWVLK